MISHRVRTAQSFAVLAVAALSIVGCSGSDVGDDPLNDGDPSTPVDQGTVVPPENQGVGGGAPVDNLDEEYNDGGLGNQESDRDNNQPSQQDG